MILVGGATTMMDERHKYSGVPTLEDDDDDETDNGSSPPPPPPTRDASTTALLRACVRPLLASSVCSAAVLFLLLRTGGGGGWSNRDDVSSTLRPAPRPMEVELSQNFNNVTFPNDEDPDDDDDDGEKPKVALLLSFPNSGTSYTLRLIGRASNMSTASNYCNHPGAYVPVYDDKTDPGPHLIPTRPHTMPKHFILTKTHCSHCTFCGPKEYVVSTKHFQRDCLTECYKDHGKHTARYSMDHVGKVVHLIRDPYTNIVSRFHCQMKAIGKKGHNKNGKRFDWNATGFQQYCAMQDAKYAHEELHVLGPNITEAGRNVPCHADFYRYISWHNHAFDMMEGLPNIPVHVMYYGDYHSDFNGTLDGVLDFLDQSRAGKLVEFHWSDYFDHFTAEQRVAVRDYVRLIATPRTLQALGRYGFS